MYVYVRIHNHTFKQFQCVTWLLPFVSLRAATGRPGALRERPGESADTSLMMTLDSVTYVVI